MAKKATTRKKAPAEAVAVKCLSLSFIWGVRLKLRAEGSKLKTEGCRLFAEGNKLRAEGDKLLAECDKLWAEGIIEAYGNITMEWKNYSQEKSDNECHLGNGLVFKP